MHQMFLPKFYHDVNKLKSKEYSDYENYENAWGFAYFSNKIKKFKLKKKSISWRNQDDYEIIKKIGRGKYSDVFEGICIKNDKKVIIKILKPGSPIVYSFS